MMPPFAELIRTSVSVAGSPAITFLGLPPQFAGSLRLHPALCHEPTGLTMQALLGLFEGSRGICAAAVIYLDEDGSAVADALQPRTIIGRPGDGAVRLLPATRRLLTLTGGVEAGLDAIRDGVGPVWCAGYLARAQEVAVPACVERIRLLSGGRVVDELDADEFAKLEEELLL